MRPSFGLVLAMTLAACSNGASGGSPDPLDPDPPFTGDDGGTEGTGSDAGHDSGPGDDAGEVDPPPPDVPPEPPPPPPAFQIASPIIDIAAGDEKTYCYYFRTPNTAELAIKQWSSHMTEGSVRMVMFRTQGDEEDVGTLTERNCGIKANGFTPVWTYATESLDAEMVMPADDGNGHPVGQIIEANQSGFLMMQFHNTTSQLIRVRVELSAHAYDDTAQVVPVAPFVAYNNRIDLPAASGPTTPSTGEVNGDCTVSKDVRFFHVSTHTQKQAVYTSIKNGGATVFDTTALGMPGRSWNAPPFLAFSTGALSYECEYENPNSYRIKTGDNASRDEMCVAVGYYFPATDSSAGNGHYCLNSLKVY